MSLTAKPDLTTGICIVAALERRFRNDEVYQAQVRELGFLLEDFQELHTLLDNEDIPDTSPEGEWMSLCDRIGYLIDIRHYTQGCLEKEIGCYV